MVVFSLVPYLVLAAALQSITPTIASQLHMSLQTVNLTSGMANAGYAVGTVLGFQLAQHLHQRRMVLVYASLLVIGSVLAAAATNPGMYIAGHILQGLCTPPPADRSRAAAGSRLSGGQAALDGGRSSTCASSAPWPWAR